MLKTEIKDYKLPFSIDETKKDDKKHIRDIFILNMDHSKELRKDMWSKLYGKKLMTKSHRLEKITSAENEWQSFDQKTKEEWFDFVTTDNMSFVNDLLMISNLVKLYKGNMRKVWASLKIYGEEKKNSKKE